jgi:hypothetical protein
MTVKFRNPPINELVIGVYFSRELEGLRAEHVGLFWSTIRAEFPTIQQQPVIVPPLGGGKLVRLNVEATERHLSDNIAAAAIVAKVFFVHDPLVAEAIYPADPLHALADGVPKINAGPEAELIGDLFLDCILETFDVVPD